MFTSRQNLLYWVQESCKQRGIWLFDQKNVALFVHVDYMPAGRVLVTGKASGTMANTIELKQQIAQGLYDGAFAKLYGADEKIVAAQRERYTQLIDRFAAEFGADRTVRLYSAPGRTEIGGNHTDHNNGVVLAGSVNLDIVAVVSPNNENIVRVKSHGFEKIDDVDLSIRTPQPREAEHSAALIRGVAAGILNDGGKVGGFDAYTTSNVLRGSGLSSSAAFEVCIGAIFRGEYNNNDLEKFSQVRIAQIGQYAENVFFGKPCGLMDETASAVGGVVSIDFKDPSNPVVRKVDFDFPATGHTLCIINSGADHADLTDAYAAITNEMKSVAACFGKEVLRDVDETTFRATIPELRKALGDRAVLRAIHFFDENRRAVQEAQALEKGDFAAFLALVRASGLSSSLYLQNTFAPSDPRQQAIPMVLWAAEEVLQGTGAVRVHGGGFAGTVQAFVPNDKLPAFLDAMERLLGRDMCHMLSIRPEGGCLVAG